MKLWVPKNAENFLTSFSRRTLVYGVILLAFSILPRKAFSILGCLASKYVLLVSTYYVYIESCLYFLLALYEVFIFHFATQPSILTTATKDPVINLNFLWVLKILISSLVPHTWLFLRMDLESLITRSVYMLSRSILMLPYCSLLLKWNNPP